MRQVLAAPSLDELEFLSADDLGLFEETRSYRLLTPLWGGGATANVVDRKHPISEKGIRGQLRFWWRATRGGAYADLTALAEAEDALWGAPSKQENGQTIGRPSRVDVVVVEANSSAMKHQEIENLPRYAMFSLWQDKNEQERVAALAKDVTFKLRLRYRKADKAAVEATLWAWETFGGIGARTRRGFGAIERTDEKADKPDNAEPSDVKEWLEKKLADENIVVPGAWPNNGMQDVPHLVPSHAAYKVNFHGSSQSYSVWSQLIGQLSSFRQSRNGVRGRSKWPEPDSVRNIAETHLVNGAKTHAPRHILQIFPRAVFGLPIIFHFKDAYSASELKRNRDIRFDPGDVILLGRGSHGEKIERLSSPLILRPLGCKNGQCAGLALVLKTPQTPPGGVTLHLQKGSWASRRTSQNVAHGFPSPNDADFPPLNKKTDVLEEFLNTL